MSSFTDLPRAGDLEHAMLYREMIHQPTSPIVDFSYGVFIGQLVSQWRMCVDAGIEFCLSPDSPRSSKELFDTIDSSGVCPILPTSTAGTLPKDHPMAQPTEISIGGKTLCANDVFRGVHDVFGHYIPDADFSPQGEFRAWVAHDSTLEYASWLALFCETRGQNADTNFLDGAYLIPRANRKFARQKCGVVPKDQVYSPQVMDRITNQDHPVVRLRDTPLASLYSFPPQR